MDGIVTDDVPKLLEMCKTFKEERRCRWPVTLLLAFTYYNVWVYLFDVVFRRRSGSCIIGRGVEVDKDKGE